MSLRALRQGLRHVQQSLGKGCRTMDAVLGLHT